MRKVERLALLILFSSMSLWAANSVPYISQPSVPAARMPGGKGFTLTINGAGFVKGAVVKWNGHPRRTNFVNTTKLTAKIPASDIITASTAFITVVNPASGAASNVAFFQIAQPLRAVSFGPPSYSIGALSYWMAAGDFNNDGYLDLETSDSNGNFGGKNHLTLLAYGNGAFQPPLYFDVRGLDTPATPAISTEMASWI